jgi:hypothetical protein
LTKWIVIGYTRGPLNLEMHKMSPADEEMTAMQTAFEALSPLDREAQVRVLGYIQARLGVTTKAAQASPVADIEDDEDAQVQAAEKGQQAAPKYDSFAELFDATQPSSNAEKALVGGYWLQVCKGADSFDGQSVNTELKNLGHGLANITTAVDTLKNQKPALALQLKKSGSSQQARKTYKITMAGIKVVEAMIVG